MFEETWEDGEPTAWWFGRRRYAVEDGIGRLLDAAWQQQAGPGRAPEPSILAPAAGPVRHSFSPPALPSRRCGCRPTRRRQARAWRLRHDGGGDGRADPSRGARMAGTRGLQAPPRVPDPGSNLGEVAARRCPTAADDIVRRICGRLGQPDGVATAEGVLAHADGKPERVIRIVGEMGGRRAERAIIMAPKPGKPEDVVPGRWMARELGLVPKQGEGWIGVAPLLPGEMITTVLGDGTPQWGDRETGRPDRRQDRNSGIMRVLFRNRCQICHGIMQSMDETASRWRVPVLTASRWCRRRRSSRRSQRRCLCTPAGGTRPLHPQSGDRVADRRHRVWRLPSLHPRRTPGVRHGPAPRQDDRRPRALRVLPGHPVALSALHPRLRAALHAPARDPRDRGGARIPRPPRGRAQALGRPVQPVHVRAEVPVRRHARPP